jgi:hypothetical protein
MVLPPLLPEQALEFIRDVLAHFRISEAHAVAPYFPFSEESCRVIIETIRESEELKPRSIMHAFNAVLQEADPKIETKEINQVSPEFARQVLAERVPLKEPEEG